MKAIIHGGVVPRGTVKVSGAKNSATRLLAATMLTDETVFIENFPTRLVDANHKMRFISDLGGSVEIDHVASTVKVDASKMSYTELADYDYPIRTTYLLVAGQIRKSGRARIPYPGGCKIGSRGYDMHVMVWRALGCEVNETVDYIEVVGKKFVGGEIRFPISTVGGTENALLCASIAQGKTDIVNAYVTPEIEDLIDLLRRMGANIQVVGASRIIVDGRDSLSGATIAVMPDRIEALTWLTYGAMTGGDILIENVPFDAMQIPLQHIKAAGVDFMQNSNAIRISPECMPLGVVQPFEVACGAHPGVISDMQPFYVLLGMVAPGVSRIFDYRYPERIAYANELAKFCATGSIEAERGKITTSGPIKFRATTAKSMDLRGSMAVIMAGLCAKGTSVIEDAHMALRGYNNLDGKLAQLGVSIEVEDDQIAAA